MSILIGLREANQHLSEYINEVEKGEEILITRHGKPIAKIIPFRPEINLNAQKKAALERSLQRMKNGYHLGGKKFIREELYDRK